MDVLVCCAVLQVSDVVLAYTFYDRPASCRREEEEEEDGRMGGGEEDGYQRKMGIEIVWEEGEKCKTRGR